MKMENNRTQCLNCGNTFKGNYCPQCGQKAATKRLRLTEMMGNAIAPFVGGDSRVMRTCLDLLIRPGSLIRDYLVGKRIRYYHPLQMFVYVLTTYAIISYILGISPSIFDEMAELDLDQEAFPVGYASIDFLLKCAKNIYSNKLYGSVFMAFLAVFPYHLLFRTKIKRQDGAMLSLNRTEQFYAQMFLSCQHILISIFLLPVCLFSGGENIAQTIYKMVASAYIIFAYKQLLGIGWIKSLLLNVLATALTLFLLIVLLVLAVTIGLVIELGIN